MKVLLSVSFFNFQKKLTTTICRLYSKKLIYQKDELTCCSAYTFRYTSVGNNKKQTTNSTAFPGRLPFWIPLRIERGNSNPEIKNVPKSKVAKTSAKKKLRNRQRQIHAENRSKMYKEITN